MHLVSSHISERKTIFKVLEMCINKIISCLNSKLSWKFLEWLILLGLLVMTGFFVREVWCEYVNRATSVKTYFEVHELMDLPTIIMCFNPSTNPMIGQKYNATVNDIFGLTDFLSNETIYDEAIYKIGRDFNITFVGFKHEHDVEIKTMYTVVSGQCYKINPKCKRKARHSFDLMVIMRKNLEFIPNISFYFTSNENSYHRRCNVVSESF